MPVIRNEQTPEQIASLHRYHAMHHLAADAGFDEEAFDATEFCLMPFFEMIVEQCARIAESQARAYTGENNEGRGSTDAATAIRAYGRTLGNESN